MSGHEPITGQEGAPEQPTKLALFELLLVPPPPEKWKFDHAGRPIWLSQIKYADLAPWLGIIPSVPYGNKQVDFWTDPKNRSLRAHGPAALPALFPQRRATSRRKAGRPRREDNQKEKSRVAAWLADIRGLTLLPIAEALSHLGRVESSSRATAKGFIEAGRELLASDRVLPWTLYSGQPPDEWWKSLEFRRALDDWYWLGYGARSELSELKDMMKAAHSYTARIHPPKRPPS